MKKYNLLKIENEIRKEINYSYDILKKCIIIFTLTILKKIFLRKFQNKETINKRNVNNSFWFYRESVIVSLDFKKNYL